MTEFNKFADLIKEKLDDICEDDLVFTVESSGDSIWDTYISSFPDGTNDIINERTEHDCSCCKNFIRNIASVVRIKDGKLDSVWDIEGAPYPYDIISKNLSEKVKGLSIDSVFTPPQRKFGARTTNRMQDDRVIQNYHFYCDLPSKFSINSSVEERIGESRKSADVLQRTLNEFKENAFENVIEMIEENLIYRGYEFLPSLKSFYKLLVDYNKIEDEDSKILFVWSNHLKPYARFKNTLIGNLIKDISSGKELSLAVKLFESNVAPKNYKRPTALISESMIKKAMETIDDLGMRDSLDRRFATISDISINDVLFADRSSKPLMKDHLMDSLLSEVKTSHKKINDKHKTKISIDSFMEDVLPNSSVVEVLMKNNQKKNLMSITTCENKDARNIFQWNNNFAWSYNGDVADSDIKQRVKAAGGNVSAPLRISLGWFNTDDLDIHVIEPDGNHISFQNKCGKLDVDMNVNNLVRDAVENVCWRNPSDGIYQVSVNNYTKRESIDVGFDIETESNGDIQNYHYRKPLGNSKTINVMDIVVKSGSIDSVKLSKDIQGGSSSSEIWGINTEIFTKVDLIMNSPNYWSGSNIGNKHWFFIINDCKNPEKTRGIYNEFLTNDLNAHRKVFEVLGSKTKCELSKDQISGLGFSSTKKELVTLRVDNRIFEVQF